jgi:hypothetical protein
VSEIVERGDAAFVRRSSRVFVVLMPDHRRLVRQVMFGRLHLPDPRRRERVWACVADVTRGQPAEPAMHSANARYAIVDHGDHTRFEYALERANADAELVDLPPQASYIVTVRHPIAPTPPGTGLPPHEPARYPDDLLAAFRRRRFIPLTDAELLDHQGAELVLVGAGRAAAGNTASLGAQEPALPGRVR